jgi:predicted transposase YbfD/YdcC
MCEKIIEKFSVIEDFRCECDVEHKLSNILILIMCGVLCGIDNIKNIVDYGKNKGEFFEKHFGFSRTPSESTLSRVLAVIDVSCVGKIILEIMQEFVSGNFETIAVDGKAICSTYGNNAKEKLHILTAYAVENGLCLAQIQVGEKTNEIPVFYEMLDILDVKGKTITSDAMGCQKETIAKIVEKEGNYCIGLKGNQGTLHKDVQTYFEELTDNNLYEIAQTSEKNRDRYEKRTCYVFKDISWLEQKSEWAGLKSVVAIRRDVERKGVKSSETLYYISSLDAAPEEFLKTVRKHWKIEALHWCLDVVFDEDGCLLQNTNAQLNLNLWRKFALTVHKNFKERTESKKSMKSTMFSCLLNDNFLIELLSQVCHK